MATPKKTRAEQTAEIPWEELVKLKAKNPEDMKKLRSYVNLLRQGYNRRIAEFKRKGIFSYAADAAKKSKVKNIPVTQLTKGMSPDRARNTLLAEFAKYQQFFQSKTSNIAGIREVNAEQDKRIFKDSTTRSTMNDDERETFWSLFEEFNSNAGITKTAYMTSSRIQQYIAEAQFSGGLDSAEDTESADEEDAKFAEKFGIERKYLDYDPIAESRLYNLYLAEFRMRKAEIEEQLGKVESDASDSPVFRGRRNY